MNLVWLSHELTQKTPAYRGGKSLEINLDKQMSLGDTCNTVSLSFSNHLGTHVDVPYHFFKDGKKISDYSPGDWYFKHVKLIDISSKLDCDIVTEEILEFEKLTDPTVDLLLIKTGLERCRDSEAFWKNAVGYEPGIATILKERFPKVKAIGIDSISLAGYSHRDLGRTAHQMFLSQDIRIFEDMKLSNITHGVDILSVVALPLLFESADGAPCTIVANINISNEE